MDQYPDDSEERFVRRFAARCQSDPELESEAVKQYGIVLRHLLQTQRPLKRPPSGVIMSGTKS